MYAVLLAVVLCGQMESQRLVIDETERERAYVGVVLPDGRRTEVPIVNGYVPTITIRPSTDRVELVLDYREHVLYDFRRFGNPIKYHKPDSTTERRQDPPPRAQLPEFPIPEAPRQMTPPSLLTETPPPKPPVTNPLLTRPSQVRNLR